jgi:hypothetical protein
MMRLECQAADGDGRNHCERAFDEPLLYRCDMPEGQDARQGKAW